MEKLVGLVGGESKLVLTMRQMLKQIIFIMRKHEGVLEGDTVMTSDGFAHASGQEEKTKRTNENIRNLASVFS